MKLLVPKESTDTKNVDRIMLVSLVGRYWYIFLEIWVESRFFY